MTTSKSPRRVFRVAYDAACQALPAHRHKFSPKKFTQPQLMACLVLKEFLRLDYRGFVEHLADHPDLGRMIGLKAVPHYTTLQKAAARLFKAAPAEARAGLANFRTPEFTRTVSQWLNLLIDAGFRLERVFPVDQFLWSPHVELVGVFQR